MSQIKEILVFHQVLSPEDKDLPSLTKIPEIVGAPGLVNYEVFLHEDKIEDAAQVTLLVAQNYKFELGPDISVVVTLVWDPVYGQFIPSFVPDNVIKVHLLLTFYRFTYICFILILLFRTLEDKLSSWRQQPSATAMC